MCILIINRNILFLLITTLRDTIHM